MDSQSGRVSFIVDGLNLYHSLREMEGLSKKPSRWLDLRRLCESYLFAIGQRFALRTELAAIHYFSAYSDLRPAITTARRLFPQNKVGVVTPFLRHTTEMQEIGDFHFKVSQKLVHASQFPNPLRLADGRVLAKPAGW